MRQGRWLKAGLAALAGLALGAASACAPTAPSVQADESQAGGETVNYVVALTLPSSAPSSDVGEAAEQLRAALERDRDRILAESFGAQAPAPGVSFVSAYAFEIRLTPEQAQRLAQHSDVASLETDYTLRPMQTGSEG